MNIIKEICIRTGQKLWSFTKHYGIVILIGGIIGIFSGKYIWKQSADYRIIHFKTSVLKYLADEITMEELDNEAIRLSAKSKVPSYCQIDIKIMLDMIKENPDENPYNYLELSESYFDKDCK
jgi:hypothetical protein